MLKISKKAKKKKCPGGHSCALCGHAWACVDPKCEVEKAAKINRQGPWCMLCYHVISATHVALAQHRGSVVTLLEGLLGRLKDRMVEQNFEEKIVTTY